MSAILVDQPVLARSNSVHGTDGAGSTVVPSLSQSSTSTAVNGSSFGDNAGIDPSGASRASGISSEVRTSCEWIYEPSLTSLLVLSATRLEHKASCAEQYHDGSRENATNAQHCSMSVQIVQEASSDYMSGVERSKAAGGI